MADTENKATALEWRGPDYARVSPGRYSAVATQHKGPAWLRKYSRWSIMLEFELLGESGAVRVCAFYNLGNDPATPRIGRQSRYFSAWVMANGEMPRKGQRMSADVFLEGQVYQIEVGESRRDSDEREKTDADVYSRVTEIYSADRPGAISNQESMNQESRIMQSPNQVINQSRKPGSANGLELLKFASARRR